MKKNTVCTPGVTVAEFDFNNTQHRAEWMEHMKLCGLKVALSILERDDYPLPKITRLIGRQVMAEMVLVIHKTTWERTYELFPQLKGLPVVFNGNTGKFETRQPSERELEEAVA